jgi:fermentation-respiration switch protein FrsA (DUF1100 family)
MGTVDMTFILRLLALAVSAWVLLVVLAWAGQRRLLYLPLAGDFPGASAALAEAEDVTLRTGDGLTLGAWFVPARGTVEATRGMSVIVFPGNAGNRALRAPLAAALSRAGFAVLLFDYRGYGGNPGRPSEEGLLRDARAAWAYLERRPGIDGERIVFFGESLGCAVAIALALEHSPRALVLRSPFTSLVEVGRLHYPFLPVRLLLRDRFPNEEKIVSVRAPVLVIAGETDSIVPPRQSQRVFQAASAPKRYLEIPGADHNDQAFLDGERLIDEVVDFVAGAKPEDQRDQQPQQPLD